MTYYSLFPAVSLSHTSFSFALFSLSSLFGLWILRNYVYSTVDKRIRPASPSLALDAETKSLSLWVARTSQMENTLANSWLSYLVYAQGKAEPYLWEEQSYCYFIESRETEIASPEHLSSRDPQILRMSHVNSSFTRPFFPYRYFYFKWQQRSQYFQHSIIASFQGGGPGCWNLHRVGKIFWATGPYPLPPKRICQTKKGNFRKNICPRVIKNKNSWMSPLNLEFNMNMTPVYEVLLQIWGT